MTLSPQQIEQFRHNGYLILENCIEPQDVESVLRIWRADPKLKADTKENANFEGEGLPTRLAYRPYTADDAYSAVACSARIVGPLSQIYDSTVSHYYTLNMQKDPATGGWEYHQDYGYHYKEFLYPQFVSVMVALDPATQENGCLRVIKGSNRLGRLHHEGLGSQRIADPERLGFAKAELEEVHCEMSPGSVLLFDGNTLHASNPNRSDYGRWSLVIAYVPDSNVWVRPGKPQMTKVDPLSDDAVRAAMQAHEERIAAG